MNIHPAILAFGAMTMACSAFAASAQPVNDYPARPIRLVAPFVAGGGTDVAARVIAQQLAEAFGQSAVADNRPRAGSPIGTDLVAKAAPDGYTLLVTHNDIAISQTSDAKLPYDTVRDFAQIAFVRREVEKCAIIIKSLDARAEL